MVLKTIVLSLYLERYLLVFIQKHAELADTDPEVSVSELIWNIETKSSKLSPLKSHSMKHTQREQQELELNHLK